MCVNFESTRGWVTLFSVQADADHMILFLAFHVHFEERFSRSEGSPPPRQAQLQLAAQSFCRPLAQQIAHVAGHEAPLGH